MTSSISKNPLIGSAKSQLEKITNQKKEILETKKEKLSLNKKKQSLLVNTEKNIHNLGRNITDIVYKRPSKTTEIYNTYGNLVKENTSLISNLDAKNLNVGDKYEITISKEKEENVKFYLRAYKNGKKINFKNNESKIELTKEGSFKDIETLDGNIKFDLSQSVRTSRITIVSNENYKTIESPVRGILSSFNLLNTIKENNNIKIDPSLTRDDREKEFTKNNAAIASSPKIMSKLNMVHRNFSNIINNSKISNLFTKDFIEDENSNIACYKIKDNISNDELKTLTSFFKENGSLITNLKKNLESLSKEIQLERNKQESKISNNNKEIQKEEDNIKNLEDKNEIFLSQMEATMQFQQQIMENFMKLLFGEK
ncbi:MAG TPA: hypothetical protein QKA14_02290 [Candidatus Megaira endosymbiont of Hartmannula sinica]|nr:hypothetical protein [Candidatus Megaera endosymbiont of Hartmannula sinica]